MRWWKETNTTQLLFRIYVLIELHHGFDYWLVSLRSFWYVDELENGAVKRHTERSLDTVGVWHYLCAIKPLPHLATWTLLHSKCRFVENRLSHIVNSGSISLYTLGGSIVLSEVCLSQNLCRNRFHHRLSIVVFPEDADDSYVMFFGRQYELLLWVAFWDEKKTVRN